MATATKPQRIEGPKFPERVTLKNIKILHGMSEETWCYTASVYVDGKKVGEVGNAGHGGPDSLHVEDKAMLAIVEAAQKQHDPSPYGEDILFGDMLNEHLLKKDIAPTHRKGYRYVVLADDSYVYGFNNEDNIEAVMIRDKRSKYRVFEK